MFNEELRLDRPLRWGMIGGGRGSLIGYIHRSSALRDGLFEMVAGAFDDDLERCIEFGVNIGVDADRCYSDYKEMIAEESRREDGLEVVSIATSDKFHYEISKAALEAGLHVICEKPLCTTVAQAEALKELAEKQGKLITVAYGYTGYQMVHQARKMIEKGDLGDIRIINMTFAHGWHKDNSDVLNDIGTHAFSLAQVMVPNLKIERLLCNRQSFAGSHDTHEDNAFVMVAYKGGAVGNLWASVANAGAVGEQKIRIVGSRASIEWCEEHPNQLIYEVQGQPKQILERGHAYLYKEDRMVSNDRIGSGHAEGLFESWSNLYLNYALAIDAYNRGDREVLDDLWFPGIDGGIDGVRLVESCVRSAEAGATWVDFNEMSCERRVASALCFS